VRVSKSPSFDAPNRQAGDRWFEPSTAHSRKDLQMSTRVRPPEGGLSAFSAPGADLVADDADHVAAGLALVYVVVLSRLPARGSADRNPRVVEIAVANPAPLRELRTHFGPVGRGRGPSSALMSRAAGGIHSFPRCATPCRTRLLRAVRSGDIHRVASAVKRLSTRHSNMHVLVEIQPAVVQP
jgi:hypothetical protein